MHPKALNVWLGLTYTLTCAFLHLKTWGGTTSYHNSIIKALIWFDFQARNCILSIVWRLNHSFNKRLSWTSPKNPKYIEPKPLWVHLLAALRQKNRPKSSSCIKKMEIHIYIYTYIYTYNICKCIIYYLYLCICIYISILSKLSRTNT